MPGTHKSGISGSSATKGLDATPPMPDGIDAQCLVLLLWAHITTLIVLLYCIFILWVDSLLTLQHSAGTMFSSGAFRTYCLVASVHCMYLATSFWDSLARIACIQLPV